MGRGQMALEHIPGALLYHYIKTACSETSPNYILSENRIRVYLPSSQESKTVAKPSQILKMGS